MLSGTGCKSFARPVGALTGKPSSELCVLPNGFCSPLALYLTQRLVTGIYYQAVTPAGRGYGNVGGVRAPAPLLTGTCQEEPRAGCACVRDGAVLARFQAFSACAAADGLGRSCPGAAERPATCEDWEPSARVSQVSFTPILPEFLFFEYLPWI